MQYEEFLEWVFRDPGVVPLQEESGAVSLGHKILVRIGVCSTTLQNQRECQWVFRLCLKTPACLSEFLPAVFNTISAYIPNCPGPSLTDKVKETQKLITHRRQCSINNCSFKHASLTLLMHPFLKRNVHQVDTPERSSNIA